MAMVWVRWTWKVVASARSESGGGPEDHRVLQQLPRGGTAGGEGAGAAGRPPGEVLLAERGGVEPRLQLGLEAVEHITLGEVVDDDTAIGLERRDQVFG